MVSPPSLATDRALSAAVCPCEPPSKARRRCVEHRLRCALHTAEFHNHRSEHVPVQYDPVKYRPCPTSTAEPPPTMLRSAGHPFPSPLSRGGAMSIQSAPLHPEARRCAPRGTQPLWRMCGRLHSHTDTRYRGRSIKIYPPENEPHGLCPRFLSFLWP